MDLRPLSLLAMATSLRNVVVEKNANRGEVAMSGDVTSVVNETAGFNRKAAEGSGSVDRAAVPVGSAGLVVAQVVVQVVIKPIERSWNSSMPTKAAGLTRKSERKRASF